MKWNTVTFKVLIYGAILFIGIGGGISCLAQTAPKSQNFAGTWEFKKCDPDGSRIFCYEFTLYLLQTGNDICGAHDAGEPNGPVDPATHQIDKNHESTGRIDEGDPGSVVGSVTGRVATFVVRSGRTGKYYLARASVNHQQMKFMMIGRFTGTDKDISEMEILPLKLLILNRSPKKFDWVDGDDKPIDLKSHCKWPTFNPTFNNKLRSKK